MFISERGGSARTPRPLTDRQRQVLAFLEDYVSDHRFPPTARELSDACDLGGPSGAHRILSALERKGYLEHSPGLSRAFTVVRPRVNGSTLDPNDLVLVITLAEYEAVSRDCSLVMAMKMDDSAIKGNLLKDALDRHELCVHIRDALVDQTHLSGLARATQKVIPTVRAADSWPLFLIDRIVCDQVGVLFGRHMAIKSRELDLIFGPVVRLFEVATVQARGWLNDLRAVQDPDEFVLLRQRAEMLISVCSAQLRDLDLGGPQSGQSFADFISLPETLFPPPVLPLHLKPAREDR